MGRGAARPNECYQVGLAGVATVIKAEGIVRSIAKGPYLQRVELAYHRIASPDAIFCFQDEDPGYKTGSTRVAPREAKRLSSLQGDEGRFLFVRERGLVIRD